MASTPSKFRNTDPPAGIDLPTAPLTEGAAPGWYFAWFRRSRGRVRTWRCCWLVGARNDLGCVTWTNAMVPILAVDAVWVATAGAAAAPWSAPLAVAAPAD